MEDEHFANEGPGRLRVGFSDPLFAYLVFAAIALGLWQLNFHLRMAICQLVLVVAVLISADAEPFEIEYSLLELGRGALIGVIVCVPVLLFFHTDIARFVRQLYATPDSTILFQRVVLLAVPIEGLFFRGLLQDRRGLATSTGLYAASGLLYFAPRSPLLALVVVVLAMGALGGVYGFVRRRYGLTASMGCQAVASLLLIVLPIIIDQIADMLA